MDELGLFAPQLAKHLIRFSNKFRLNPDALSKHTKTDPTNTGNDSRNRTILMNLQGRKPKQPEEQCDIRAFQYALLMLKSIPAGMPEHLVEYHSNLRTKNGFPSGLINRDKLDVIKQQMKLNSSTTIRSLHSFVCSLPNTIIGARKMLF